jgi:hypothetical protein
LRLSLAEYLRRWEAKRPEVLGWHDPRLMQYPASVAVTWETTFLQLTEGERQLLEILSWLAPEPIPLVLFETATRCYVDISLTSQQTESGRGLKRRGESCRGSHGQVPWPSSASRQSRSSPRLCPSIP